MGEGIRRRTVLATALALAPLTTGCATEPKGPPPAAGPPPKDVHVLLLRHAERPYAGDLGEDEDGEPTPGELSVRGRRRAAALPLLFGPTRGADALPRPAALFAAGGPEAHCRQTLAPLAEALELPVRTRRRAGDEADLAREVLAAPSPVLVCWEHPGIPALIRALGAGGVLGLPAGWPDRYDLVWSLTRTAGRWRFGELAQHLLPGDA
ncbi:hypothetical protein [Streptomyces sp. NPDC097619]|uniref:hypothetical protein n=1 Tax=Streptomyces sp. NPDC097619 TaxID=3157228 RepID=UPI00333011F2